MKSGALENLLNSKPVGPTCCNSAWLQRYLLHSPFLQSEATAVLGFASTDLAFKPFAAAILLAVLHAACCLPAMAMRCTLCCSMPCVAAFLAAGRCSHWRLFAAAPGVHILLLPKLRACALELLPLLPLGPLLEQPYAKQ
jgi:hypothetical protein